MILFPKAKINIGLYVQEKRPDGYHNILTYMRSVDFCDVLEIQSSDEYCISYSGWPIEKSELIDEMARWLIDRQWISPLKIHLHKNIPIGSGLGGGSSNLASFTRYVLDNESFSGNRQEVLDKMKTLSTDSFYFFNEKTAIVSGKGDVLDAVDIDLNGLYLLLCLPSVKINTGDAFSAIESTKRDSDHFKNKLKDIRLWRKELSNDFEGAFAAVFPDYEKMKENLYEKGALFVSLSGTGSAFYGIFKEKVDIDLKPFSSKWIAL